MRSFDELDVVILGGGATGIEFADHLRLCCGGTTRIGVIDDDVGLDISKWRERNGQILGGREVLELVDAPYLVAVGDPNAVAELSAAADSCGLTPLDPVIHPSAVLAPGARLGPGSVVYPQAALSTDVEVGRLCQIHLGVTIGHDTRVGDHCILTPGVNVSGDCHLGDDVFVGTGTVLLPGVDVGSMAVVGAGSVVTSDVPGATVAFGNPARTRRSIPVKT